ncbi:hypothetical protein EDD85DRAFT_80483 [Armillaria nabsnona]|nr:hypothetical protein EDD85DRAFT_80483 [Armillaria nabsnona]
MDSGGGEGNGRRVILSMKTAHRQMYWEGNARPYPHDPLLREVPILGPQWREVCAQGCIRSKNISGPYTPSLGMPCEDYGFVSGWWRSHFGHDIWRLATKRPGLWRREQDDACCPPSAPYPKRGFPVPYNPLIPLTPLPLRAHSLRRSLLFGFLPRISPSPSQND